MYDVRLSKGDLLARYCRFFAVLIGSLIVINLIIAIGIQNRSLPDGTIRMMILEGVILVSWLFAKRRRVTLSAFIFILGPFWAFFIYPLMPFFNSKPAEDLFLCIFTMVVLNGLVLLVYDLKYRFWIGGWISIILIFFFISFDHSLAELDGERYHSLKTLFSEEPLLLYAIVGCAVFLIVVVIRIKSMVERSQAQLQIRTGELSRQESIFSQQNERLQAARTEMELLKNELYDTNRSLEKKIMQRTAELEEINQRIIDHGFTHTKTIVDPLGELEILTDQIAKDPALSKQKLNKITHQLDDIITSINDNLSVAESKLS